MPETNEAWSSRADAHLMLVSAKPPIVMERGEGMELFDVEGRRYLDFIGGWAVDCLGHSPRALAAALAEQSSRLVNASPSFWNKTQVEFAEKLTAVTGLDKVWFGSTGAEANEGAIKLARKWGSVCKAGAYEIITTVNSFHGRTLATMAASGKEQWRTLFPPRVPGFVHVPFDDLDALQAAVTDRTAAVMIELVQGEGGAVPASPEYVRRLRALCDERRILLILDEVQSGFGRTGKWFAFEHFHVLPDIITAAKGLASGMPLSGVFSRTDIMLKLDVGSIGGTYGGNAVACAAGVATIRAMRDEEMLENAAERGIQLMTGLRKLQEEYSQIGDVRGKGLMIGTEFVVDGKPAKAKQLAKDIIHCAEDRGLLLLSCGTYDNTIRWIPPLNVTSEQINNGLQIFESALKEVIE